MQIKDKEVDVTRTYASLFKSLALHDDRYMH
jgi:hypothetical protein